MLLFGIMGNSQIAGPWPWSLLASVLHSLAAGGGAREGGLLGDEGADEGGGELRHVPAQLLQRVALTQRLGLRVTTPVIAAAAAAASHSDPLAFATLIVTALVLTAVAVVPLTTSTLVVVGRGQGRGGGTEAGGRVVEHVTEGEIPDLGQAQLVRRAEQRERRRVVDLAPPLPSQDILRARTHTQHTVS